MNRLIVALLALPLVACDGKDAAEASTASPPPFALHTAASQPAPSAASELPPEGRKALGVDYGLVVEDVRGGTAAASGIRAGDVIVAVGREPFRSLDEFNKLLAQRKKGERVPLPVRRGESALYVPVELA
ncbi:MAG TPA: PDZ domain-containing protein [Burkholderiales bacterium]|nr:PDZ domain-containing protein [Burkholderiales bacterium]